MEKTITPEIIHIDKITDVIIPFHMPTMEEVKRTKKFEDIKVKAIMAEKMDLRMRRKRNHNILNRIGHMILMLFM